MIKVKKSAFEKGRTYENRRGDKRRVHDVRRDGMIQYSVPGQLNIMSLSCSIEQFQAWLDRTALEQDDQSSSVR